MKHLHISKGRIHTLRE